MFRIPAPNRISLTVAMFLAALACASVQAVDFSRDIRPILAAHCFNCHGRDVHGKVVTDLIG